jgi:hypothetical protein
MRFAGRMRKLSQNATKVTIFYDWTCDSIK